MDDRSIRSQVAPEGGARFSNRSERVTGVPPAIGIFISAPVRRLRKPTVPPSGDKNGIVGSCCSEPAISVGAS